MNWKDCPHLFATSNFKIKYGDKNYSFLGMDQEGWNCRLVMPRDVEPFAGLNEETYKSLGVCTLIARPISDMTDEEVRVYNSNWEGNENYGRNIFVELINTETAPSRLFLYLLSIGVYPFDDDTDVIFK